MNAHKTRPIALIIVLSTFAFIGCTEDLDNHPAQPELRCAALQAMLSSTATRMTDERLALEDMLEQFGVTTQRQAPMIESIATGEACSKPGETSPRLPPGLCQVLAMRTPTLQTFMQTYSTLAQSSRGCFVDSVTVKNSTQGAANGS